MKKILIILCLFMLVGCGNDNKYSQPEQIEEVQIKTSKEIIKEWLDLDIGETTQIKTYPDVTTFFVMRIPSGFIVDSKWSEHRNFYIPLEKVLADPLK